MPAASSSTKNTKKPATATKVAPPAITLKGVRTHNLKNISCNIPHRTFTVVTGVSGSGKSSLAFDTLYAEGQRRYVESLSTYARQFLERLEKPDVDDINHILPAIALEQKNSITNARSTVGTATELVDQLRVLFAHRGQVAASLPTELPAWVASAETIDERETILQHMQAMPERTKVLLVAPAHIPKGTSAEAFKRLVGAWQHNGLVRWVDKDGEVHALAENPPKLRAFSQSPLLVLDRLVTKPAMDAKRLWEAVDVAVKLQHPAAQTPFWPVPATTWVGVLPVDDTHADAFLMAPTTKLTPQHLAFNHPLGACTTCQGYGRVIGLDMAKVIPNRDISLAEGAVHPFNTPAAQEDYDRLMDLCKREKIPTGIPFKDLSEDQQHTVMEADGGVRPFFDWLETKRYKMHVRVFLAKYRGFYPCTACNGDRLNSVARSATLAVDGYEDTTLPQTCGWPLQNLAQWVTAMADGLDAEHDKVLARMCHEMLARLNTLVDLGLGYLTLSRQSRTLSGGEMQRIQLTSAIGAWLTDTLYVFDEPTVGLHARDTEQLLGVLARLRDLGNTLVVVEHDPDMILGADHIIDLGPKAGTGGGRIVFDGAPNALLVDNTSATAAGLRDYQQNTIPDASTVKLGAKKDWLSITGASGNNLKDVTVSLPTTGLVAIVGVSGSGKSTLIKHTLFANVQHKQGKYLELDAAPVDSITGTDRFADVILVDQTPPGRSQRSNPATYVKAWDGIRKLYGNHRQAKALGLSPSDFSFNRPGGRCETCEGLGFVTIDMQFMADVVMTCTDCHGRRFSPQVLSIALNDKTIDDVLAMTVEDAITFFNAANTKAPKTEADIVKRLTALHTIGLGYLTLGQATSTISGGEAQRMKLASYLLESNKALAKPYLFMFDEPTTGLHMQDIDTLITVLQRLVDAGHGVLVIEHHLQLIAAADYVVELGPEGGDAGGELVFAGTQTDFRACTASPTAQCLPVIN